MNVSLQFVSQSKINTTGVQSWLGLGGGGGMSAQWKLHVMENGILTAARYFNEIFDVHVRPYAGSIDDLIPMDNNARAHMDCITNQYLERATIVLLDWPARSHRTRTRYATEIHVFPPSPISICLGAQTNSP